MIRFYKPEHYPAHNKNKKLGKASIIFINWAVPAFAGMTKQRRKKGRSV